MAEADGHKELSDSRRAELASAGAPDASVAAIVVQRLLDAVETAGVSRLLITQAIERAGLRAAISGERVARRTIEQVCELALDLTKDEALGLHWAETLTERTFNPISHLLTYARSLREALDLLSEYQQLFCTEPFYALHERGVLAQLRFFGDWSFSSEEAARFAAEMTVGGFLLVLGLYCPPGATKEVRFAYAEPSYRDEYTRVLGARVCFDHAFTGVIFDRSLLDVPSVHWDDELQGALRNVADRRLLRMAQRTPYGLRVRDLVKSSMPTRLSMPSAARALGMSVRTLRRLLSEEGTSYRAEESAALESVAEHLLRDKRLTIQETAHAMGFSDAATFHRAFKQWTGVTPSAFRLRG